MSPSASKYLAGLNPPQREAVQQTEGPVLVLAGAGSGKTRVITQRIAYIIKSGKAGPENILAVTFTNKAAGEMRERVAKLIGKKAAAGITISTFHSFCLQVLREHIQVLGYRKNFTISSEGDMRTMVGRVLDDMQGTHESFSPALFMQHISGCKSADKEPEKVKPKAKRKGADTEARYVEWLPEVYERYQSALRAANTLDFDDLLLLTLRLWREQPQVLSYYQERYRYVMVDEYQDTNHVQYSLLHTLVREHQNLFVVGDDDQSIYGWRGADVRNILDFERDFHDAVVVTLDQNYRSTQTILEAANRVIANNLQRRDKKLWSDLGRGRPLDWIVVGDEDHEAKMVVKWLRHIQSKTGAKASQFAVLYRSNLQSRPFELTLRQAQIPYYVVGGQEFFERAEVKDIIAYLKVIANPRDEASFLRVVNMPRRGIGDATLHKVHELCARESLGLTKALAESLKRGMASKQAEAGIRDFLRLVNEYRQRFRAGSEPLKVIVKELISDTGYYEELRRVCKSEQQFINRWNNVEAVLNAVAAYEAEIEEGKPTLFGFLDQSSLNRDDNRSRDERRETGVALMTIHSAKGLEFPFVFIVGMEDGLLPHENSVKENGLDEERRLFYVALTRGQRHVTLFEALSRTRRGQERMTKTSRFMKEIPEELLTVRTLAARDMVQDRVAPPKPKPKKRRPRNKRA